jgi:hypothetical protein
MTTIFFRVWSRYASEVIQHITNRLVQPHYGIPYHVRNNSDGSVTYCLHTADNATWQALLGDLKAHGKVFDIQSKG